MQSTNHPPSGRSRALLTLSAAALVVLVAAGTVVLLVADLPDPVITHWGPGGEPDGWTSRAAVPWMAALLTLTVGGVLLQVSRLIDPGSRHLWTGLALATAVLVGIVCYAIPWAQRIGPDGAPGEVALGPILAVACAGAVLAGGGLAWAGRTRHGSSAGRPHTRPSAHTRLPADADLLDAPAGARVAWSGVARPSGVTLAFYTLVILGTATLLWWTATAWSVLFVLVPGVLLLPFLTARVTVGEPGLRVASLGGLLPWFRVSTSEIEVAGTARVRPIGDFGGWGIRIARDGRRGYITRGGTALEVRRVGLPPVLVTVDDAAAAAATLNTLVNSRSDLG